jgi:hypothetical protein
VKKTIHTLALLAVGASVAVAQPAVPRPALAIPSMGQPPLWEPYVVPGGIRLRPDIWQGMFTAGVHKPIMNPVTGVFGVAGEGYAIGDGRLDPDYGARVLATSRVFGLSAGVDWNGRSNDFDAVLSFQTAVRRGGLIGGGTMLRVDWLPGRSHSLSFGLHKPLFQRWAGRTRPFDTDVDPPSSHRVSLGMDRVPPAAETPLTKVAQAATMLLAYTNLFAQDTARVRYGESFTFAAREYEGALAEAFRVAVGNALVGDAVARRARAGLLDHVIIPFDSLFGQVKEHPLTIRPLTAAAQGSFVTWLRDSARVDPAAQPALASVHARWLGIVEAMHRHLLDQWRDSRLVWLPLQLALTEEEYDEQREVDTFIERAVGRPFTDQNAVTYLRSVDIPLEIARSIIATRDYHVLWTHDFAGQRTDTKAVDEVSFAMVADAYLPALTQAVLRYDSTRHMPIYMVLIDQFFYASRNGRLWMDILENPLHAKIRLPGNGAREAHLRMRQQELREAVAKSWRLQQDARAGGGERFLRKAVKVGVNVLVPSDFSFRSHHSVPPWPFVPDNIMRDHRKLVFYDLAEADPYRGAAIIMGVGVGEHYASDTWEDRAYRLRGPAAQELRAATRRALVSNGWKESDIPPPLQAARSLEQWEGTTEYVGRALQVHNEVGFGAKESSVARAMLYNLAPPGSVIVVPDPIWVSETWAAMLAGAAARGAKVHIISPSKPNSPNPQAALAVMQHDVMLRLLEIRDRLETQIKAAGGELRVGLFSGRATVSDVRGRITEVREGLRRAPWIREVIPFDDATLAVLDRAVVQTEADGNNATAMARDARPRAPMLHQKTQLIARPGAIAALVRQPGWDELLASAMQTQSRQSAKFADQLGFVTPDVDTTATRSADAMLRGYEQALSDAERKAVSFYFSLGNQNQDPRGMMLDGEATLLVSGMHAATGLVDLYYLMARSTWITTRAELETLVPRPRGLMARIARIIRLAL